MEVIIGGKWIINLFIVALPWAGFSFMMMLYNIVFNAWINKWWAFGNIYLMANTVYGFYQWLNSMCLAFEFPIYMRQFILVRWMSVYAAFLYNGVYFFNLGFWLW